MVSPELLKRSAFKSEEVFDINVRHSVGTARTDEKANRASRHKNSFWDAKSALSLSEGADHSEVPIATKRFINFVLILSHLFTALDLGAIPPSVQQMQEDLGISA